MPPFNEMKQLERKATVYTLLQQDNISTWAIKFWTNVFNTIAMNEETYNARIKADRIMKEMSKDVRYKR
jgi:hypothetical protein|tara:strand:+ start:349 stop:555 length:207 start_codon:yes stop_codon:yes gene_type:complete